MSLGHCGVLRFCLSGRQLVYTLVVRLVVVKRGICQPLYSAPSKISEAQHFHSRHRILHHLMGGKASSER